ncbi:MAG: cupredoxin domain-containing protein [Thermoanaerobaculia bacterium]
MRAVGIVFLGLSLAVFATAGAAHSPASTPDYLPDAAGQKTATISASGSASAGFVVMTEAVAVKETGPKETVRAFGETYQFSPPFLAVRRDEPTRIEFWNLQPDDEHDILLLDPAWNVLMKQTLPPLKKRSWVFTFREEGLYRFYCTVHLPEMAGQILVLPPRKR